ncbi:component of IIS longevity pathway SMK-1-domain-containing protein [Boeremia exigua]|uniref:component of IIS longevity pathway SMK-1-domain-containing protein n=1 Tax=Boeremia exigua TaxID=749465 RepID=UPI001E8D5ACB|nr:component of IIS longevity pathway SMK-1-domain-containing protein [Boeremia exigua]KAH6625636.1 component of IIS longevity pathway SMK-1-domain-containing protein [Boeremia exigua]
MMALVAPPAQDRKRVKVYELKNNDWFDRGTGFCRGVVVNQEDAKIVVLSEDDQTRQLLETRISKDDGYQKQQDTLIVWTEQNGTDMALSFQEPEGCANIWDFVNEVQSRLQQLAQDDGLSDDVDNIGPIMLPNPDLGNLHEIENHMRAANSTPGGRDALAKFILAQKYIPMLIPLVDMAEDLESVSDLHRLCSIMKLLILLNDTSIIEYVVHDDIILGVVGALEYDPDFPLHKANHRQYLADESKFKEVVKIEDEMIKRKIHSTYRLQYLKDVVLARILDDPTFSVLNSLIFFHQVDIVQHLQANLPFLKELFSIFSAKEQNMQRKKDAVLFIQQCCAIAKSLQANARAQLYQNFISNGLLEVIQFALKHQDASVRVAGTDILVSLIDHDALMVRSYIFKAIQEKSKPLTDTLIELLLIEVDLGVKAQMADAIKILLDPNANSASIEALGRTNSDFLAKMRGQLPSIPQTDSFIQNFYDESARKLFQPLKDLEGRESMNDLSIQDVSLYAHLVEVLCFFIRQHSYRSKYFILSEGLAARVGQLMSCPEKHLKLTALKYFRTVIALHDETHNRQIIQHQLFEPILQVLFDTMPRDNLLNSACLELFEFIKRENIKIIVQHLVETYREKLQDITYVDTFQNLILRYDQMQEPVTTQELDHSFTSVESETPVRTAGLVNGGKWGQGLKDIDAEEEAYFNTSDDEDELAAPGKVVLNGASPVRPLVNYPDDDAEEGDVDMDIPLAMRGATAPVQAKQETKSSKSTIATGSPPERISEKRRREEDEEDELLANISTTTAPKRRASTSSNTSTSTLRNLRRRSPQINSGKDGGTPKKITISLPVKSSGENENE